MRRTAFAALLAGLALAGCEADLTAPVVEPEFSQNGDDHDDEVRTYRVTVRNMTSTQPLTPPLVATHERGVRIFRVGHRASEGVKEIAENGNLGPLEQALLDNDHVSNVVIAAGDPPPLLQEQEITFEIEADEDAEFLSWVSMLICSNDGFTGRTGIRLPRRVGQTRRAFSRAYDAGTEINTEDFADIVPPCQIFGATSSDDPGTGMSNPELAEGRRIHPHRGIQGGDDLDPELHGWRGAIARLSVTRIG